MGASLRLAGLGGFTDRPLPFYSTVQAKLPSRRMGRAADRPGDHIKVEVGLRKMVWD